MRVLITGGAGFVGGSLARSFLERRETTEVVLLDNLRRRGSEWNLQELMSIGARFVHGDVRNPADLEELSGNFDVMIEASAEPSVHSGTTGSPRYVLDTNLGGAVNCLEFARLRCAAMIFLSSSRVYSIGALRALPLARTGSRLDLSDTCTPGGGVGYRGITEEFTTDGPRSYYGASKLAAELLCQEYAAHSDLRVIINRCGVISGPWQFGKTDQGVFALWVAHHYFGLPLRYTGFGGEGLQVRDLLHPADLSELLVRQIESMDAVSGRTFNVGGGRERSVSLQEFTNICREAVGREVEISRDPTTATVDIPWYVSDHTRATNQFGWTPMRSPRDIVRDITSWLADHRDELSQLFGNGVSVARGGE